MVGQRDKFSGNILFYDYLLAKRNPVFLNRNLVRALEIDQQILQHGSTDRILRDDHRDRSEWQPPTLETLGLIMENQDAKASFYLESYGIQILGKQNVRDEKSQAEPRTKSRALFSIRCTINVAIHHADSDVPCAQRPDPEAIISGSERDGERILVVNTVPMDPITFEELSRNSVLANTKSPYKMRLTITFSSTSDTEEFFRHLGPEYAERTIQKQLSAVWDDILKVPKRKTVLPLTDQQGPLQLGLEVAMYRICAVDTPALVEYNRGLRNKTLCSKYPTPQPEAQYELTFVYGDKAVTYNKIVCPHCLDRRKQADIDALRLHLDAWHDHLTYRVVHHEVDVTGVQHWKFECEVENYKTDQRASDRAEEPFDVLVIPPKVPFNRRAYLDEGNDEYQRAAKLEKSVKSTSGRSVRTSTTVAKPTTRRKPPSEVQARIVAPKKKYRVPKAPNGIHFFRLVSKRPLHEGEYVSESDDDVDETWVQQRKAAEKKKHTAWSEARRTFVTSFDLFMYEEGVNSDVHAEAALIRFARCKAPWIWQNQIWAEFEAKIQELRDDDIISQAAYSACVDIVRQAESVPVEKQLPTRRKLAQTDPTTSKTRPSNRAKAAVSTPSPHPPSLPDPDGDIEMNDATPANPPKQPTPSLAPTLHPTEPPYNQCLCGLDALASSRTGAVVECADLDCIRQLFHVECIAQRNPAWRTPKALARDWTCGDCVGGGA